MDNNSCLRCKTPMEGPFREKFQLGQQGIMNSHLAHLRAGALEVDLYHCPKCGKLEMFLPNQAEPETEDLSENDDKECPDCGLCLDLDQKVCPCCGYQFPFR